jgi:hypothetical protein
MSENIPPPVWPPRRTRLLLLPSNNHALSNYAVPAIPSIPRITDSSANTNPLSPIVQKQWPNGYEKAPKAPSFEPYAMPRRGALKDAGKSSVVIMQNNVADA